MAKRPEIFADREAYRTARHIAGQFFTPAMAKAGDRRFFALRRAIYDALVEAGHPVARDARYLEQRWNGHAQED